MRWMAVAVILVAGCATDGTDNADRPDAPTVDAAAVLADLQTFAGTYGDRAANTEAHEGAREWLAERFAAAGLEVWRQDFETGIPQQNIAGILWGEERDAWIVVGAHYDTASKVSGYAAQAGTGDPVRARSQGAYDDGSGTLMVVHLAQAYAAAYHGTAPARTIVFVAFDGEERGLQGSEAFVTAVVDGSTPYGAPDLHAMLDLDMFGLNWPGVDAPVYMDTNSPELHEAAEAARLAAGMPDDMMRYQGISLGRSDYAHFEDAGVPTAFFIASFEEWQLPADLPYTVTALNGQTAYPFWHLEDTYDTMVLMAGSQDDLEAGFQVGVDLAGATLERMMGDLSVEAP